ncbi:MAG: YafY family protein [Gammaproteobacteria bacterium]|nr:MAG: YafY family protein [Gammaproteobacteria bacterium]
MRRADRLFQIIQLLRPRRLTTAHWLAKELEVSARTIYRDIADLQASGVPIDGEAGLGYVLHHSFDLPPLMFDVDEITALVLGAGVVRSWADEGLAKAAQQALTKIEVVLPERLKGHLLENNIFSPMRRLSPQVSRILEVLRESIERRFKVEFDYVKEDGTPSKRRVWPLGLFFWGTTWTLAAWCELRHAFRNFRVDRIKELQACKENYAHTTGRTLNDFLKQVQDSS